MLLIYFFFFNDTATTEIYTLSLHDALPISPTAIWRGRSALIPMAVACTARSRSEEHTSELQSRLHLVCRLLLEKKKKNRHNNHCTRKQIVASSAARSLVTCYVCQPHNCPHT